MATHAPIQHDLQKSSRFLNFFDQVMGKAYPNHNRIITPGTFDLVLIVEACFCRRSCGKKTTLLKTEHISVPSVTFGLSTSRRPKYSEAVKYKDIL